MIDTVYHMCLYAFLLGNRKNADMYFELIREEYRHGGSRDALTQEQYKTLKEIRQALATGSIAARAWVNEYSSAPDGKDGVTVKQDTIVRRLHQEALPGLKAILGQDIELANLEHPCPPYGRVDMFYRSPDTAYPVEVKVKSGEHDLIGQILKYNLHMKLQLHYHLYERVRPVTICSGYDPHVLRELKANGIETLVYYESGDRLKVKAI